MTPREERGLIIAARSRGIKRKGQLWQVPSSQLNHHAYLVNLSAKTCTCLDHQEGGHSKVAYVGTIQHGQELNVMVLLDSDKDGQDAYDQLVKQWILKDDTVLMLGKVLNITHQCTLEDLFDETYYLEHTQAAFKKELGKNKLALAAGDKPIIVKIEEAMAKFGIDKFNKGRVGKRIMADLAGKALKDLAPTTVERFRQTFTAINGVVAKWKAKRTPN